MEAYKGAPCCKALLSTRLQARRSFSRLNRNRISEWKPKLRFRDVFNKVPARTVPGSISRPSCSDAREMISYIHARISEKQSNIEILIHGNSTPFLLRDTRAFEGTSAWNEYLKGGEREREREKEREGEREEAILRPTNTMIPVPKRLWAQFYRSQSNVPFFYDFYASIKFNQIETDDLNETSLTAGEIFSQMWTNSLISNEIQTASIIPVSERNCQTFSRIVSLEFFSLYWP